MNDTLAGVDKLAALIRRLDGNHDKGAGALAELLVEHGVVLYCTHPRLARTKGLFGYAAECDDCDCNWWRADGPPQVMPQRIAGIDPYEPVGV